jgi:tetratricopeptide (TPR) repeat protein
MTARFAFIAGVAATVALGPSSATAQLETFVQGVREVAVAINHAEPARSNEIRAASDRMSTGLAEWDRRIGALEARVKQAGGADAYPLHVELGVAYRTRGRIDDALREFDAASALRPSSSDLQVLRALTLDAAGRLADAATAFQLAWTLDPDNPVKTYYAATTKASSDTAVRDRARAAMTDQYRHFDATAPKREMPAPPFATLAAIPDNLSRSPIVADSATAKGIAQLIAERYGDAVAALAHADVTARLNTGDAPADHFARAQRAEAGNRVADARREYQSSLAGALAGRSPILVAIGRLAQVEGDLTGAIDAFTQAVRLNPNDANIRKEFAATYIAAARPGDAFCELVAALLIDSRDAHAHSAIGQLYLDTGRTAEAVAAFRRALELMPSAFEVRYALATALSRAGDTAEAARQFEAYERQRRAALEQRRRDLNEAEREERARGR